MYPLESGIPCIEHDCNICCFNTLMPLTKKDLKKIRKLGYQIEDFAIIYDGYWRLKNISGKCVFLIEKGCIIYNNRPQGCHLYPLIYDEDFQKPIFDTICPFNREFIMKKNDFKRLTNLLKVIEKEKDKI